MRTSQNLTISLAQKRVGLFGSDWWPWTRSSTEAHSKSSAESGGAEKTSPPKAGQPGSPGTDGKSHPRGDKCKALSIYTELNQ